MSTQQTIRTLVVDDHALFREGLVGILNAQPDFEVVGEAADGTEAVVKARELVPDLVLMDILLPGTNGLEATRLIKQELPATCIVVLTVRDDDEALFQAIRAGAQGYLLKTARSQELLEYLRGAVRGEAAIPPILASRILEEFRRLSQRAPRAPEGAILPLTHREQEVLRLVARGATDKEIANALCVSVNTVKSHMRNILSKLHLNRRYEAALFAIREGLIPPPKPRER
ncbi:MAG: response regulator transcription factor [Armatimonadota bacterium]|nr:response regulator transcription factor [Armatimonadota bacterium]MDR5702509.1 response regulator transcription factor [Armatimonadota bacterium]MDR7434045.1 response regulator transcription factor [Armatimonadota bacterium]